MNQAEAALLNNEVPVGCIFVYDNSVVLSTGLNSTNDSLSGIKHAEIIGIERILNEFDLISQENVYNGAKELLIRRLFGRIDLYVTVEPCIMCGSVLRQMGIKRVFFGAGNDRFGGNGSILSVNKAHQDIDAGYVSYPDFGRYESIMLLRKFYVQENKKAPVPRATEGRVLKYNEFPVLKFEKYLTKSEFVNMYGEDQLWRYSNDKWYISEEGIEVETDIDSFMPMDEKLYKEIQLWSVDHGRVMRESMKIAKWEPLHVEYHYDVKRIMESLTTKRIKISHEV